MPQNLEPKLIDPNTSIPLNSASPSSADPSPSPSPEPSQPASPDQTFSDSDPEASHMTLGEPRLLGDESDEVSPVPAHTTDSTLPPADEASIPDNPHLTDPYAEAHEEARFTDIAPTTEQPPGPATVVPAPLPAVPETETEEENESTEEEEADTDTDTDADADEKDTGKPKNKKNDNNTNGNGNGNGMKRTQGKTVFWLVTPIILIVGTLVVLSFTVPGLLSVLGNVFITIAIIVFVLFIILGIFVMVGLRDQARTLISILFEGGAKYIDMAQFLSDLWDEIIRLVQEIILFLAPIMAIILAIFLYYIVMYTFRLVAVHSDVTAFTIVLTVVLACVTAALSLSNFGQASDDDTYSFRSQLSFRFGRVFVDAVEIVVVVIFLTIDMPNPFFLPEQLHGEVIAEFNGIDLMARGIDPSGFGDTFRIAALAVFVEVVRKIYRIIASMIIRYKQIKAEADEMGTGPESPDDSFELIRRSLRLSFRDNLDDLTKFVGYTTAIIFVFLFFPRLKLVSLFVFNLTNLAWDIAFPRRAVKPIRSEDLLSRLIAKTFKM